MLRQTTLARRYTSFEKARKVWGLDANFEAQSMFPLLHSGSLIAKAHRTPREYRGRRAFDEDHPLPVLEAKSSEHSDRHEWTEWDRFLNPQLISDYTQLPQTVDYYGKRSGHLVSGWGWRKAGDTKQPHRKRAAGHMLHNWRPNEWAETRKTPVFMRVPRLAAIHPDSRWQGKLQFVDLKLSKIVWAIDSGNLNRNEVLTLNILVNAGILPEQDVVWPGVHLKHDLRKPLKYPLHIELQNADPEAIAAIETAGGSFTGTYMSIDGLYQEMRPEEFPSVLDQNMPDRTGFQHIASNPRVRGWLAQWAEDESRAAPSSAGRRLSHYRRPPHRRDFPATYEEYEHVRHQQKWHLNQNGTGTVLPFIIGRSYEDARAPNVALTDPMAGA